MKPKRHFIAGILFITLLLGSVIFYGNWFRLEKAQAETKAGASTKANTLTSGNDGNSDVANDAMGDFVITWESDGQPGDPDSNGKGVYFQLYNNIGEPQLPSPDRPADVLVNNGRMAGDQFEPTVAMDANGNFVIVWADNNNGSGSYSLFAQAYSKDGSAIGSAVQVNTSANLEITRPDIGIDFNGTLGSPTSFVVVWEQSTIETGKEIMMQRMQVDFTRMATPTLVGTETQVSTVGTGTEKRPKVAMNTNGEFIVTWNGWGLLTRSDDIWYQAYDNNGNPLGSKVQVNSGSALNPTSASITTDKKDRDSRDGSKRHYIITYNGNTPDNINHIFARQISCQDPDPNNRSDADIACNLGIEVTVNTSVAAAVANPDVSSDYLGNFTVVWENQSDSRTTQKNILAQSYRYNDAEPYGAVARYGNEFRINNDMLEDHAAPAISMNADGAYIVTFSETSDGPTTDVLFQPYISDLFKDGNETLANSSDSVTQTETDVAIAPDGRYAEVWHGLSPNGIYFTLWDANGNIIVQDQRIDSDGAINDHANPTIAFFKDTSGNDIGRFVIAWSGSVPNCGTDYANSRTDIWYREITPTGAPVGSCERKAHPKTENDGSDSYPQISAGYYNNDGGPVEDNFAIIYTHQEGTDDFISGSFHNGTSNFLTVLSDFTVNTLSGVCTDCDRLKGVALNPSNNRIIYAWSQDNSGTNNGIFIREASMGNLLGDSPQLINILFVASKRLISSSADNNIDPAVTWLPNNQFMLTFTAYNSEASAATVLAARYEFDGSDGIANQIDAPFEVSDLDQETTFQTGANVTSDPESGTFMVIWVNNPIDLSPVNKIFGQLFQYKGPEAGNIERFGTNFTINSTKEGNRTAPSIDMNSSGNIITGWEGNFQNNVGQPDSGNDDSAGAIAQTLLSPLYAQEYPRLQPEAREEVSGGGRTLNVPDSLEFPETIVSDPHSSATVEVSVRNNTLPNPAPLQYIEFEDLDGAPAVITVSAQNFIRTSDNRSYIPVTNFSVKNCDQDLASDDQCKVTLNGNAADLNLENAETADNDSGGETFYHFASEVEQKTLATKSGNSLGKWRIFPKFKLEIPPTTPPGNHTTVITFSLT